MSRGWHHFVLRVLLAGAMVPALGIIGCTEEPPPAPRADPVEAVGAGTEGEESLMPLVIDNLWQYDISMGYPGLSSTAPLEHNTLDVRVQGTREVCGGTYYTVSRGGNFPWPERIFPSGTLATDGDGGLLTTAFSEDRGFHNDIWFKYPVADGESYVHVDGEGHEVQVQVSLADGPYVIYWVENVRIVFRPGIGLYGLSLTKDGVSWNLSLRSWELH